MNHLSRAANKVESQSRRLSDMQAEMDALSGSAPTANEDMVAHLFMMQSDMDDLVAPTEAPEAIPVEALVPVMHGVKSGTLLVVHAGGVGSKLRNAEPAGEPIDAEITGTFTFRPKVNSKTRISELQRQLDAIAVAASAAGLELVPTDMQIKRRA